MSHQWRKYISENTRVFRQIKTRDIASYLAGGGGERRAQGYRRKETGEREADSACTLKRVIDRDRQRKVAGERQSTL